MVRFSRRAFFDARPVFTDPALDALFVTLGSPEVGLLWTPVDPIEQPSNVGFGVPDPEAAADDFSDASSGPNLAAKAEVGRTFREQFGQALEVFFWELGRSAGAFAMPEGFLAVFASAFEPLADGTGCDAERFGNGRAGPAFLVEFEGAQAAGLTPVLGFVVCHAFMVTTFR